MKKFAAGFIVCWLGFRFSPLLIEILNDTAAKIKQDNSEPKESA